MINMFEKHKFFDVPRQVKFIDPDTGDKWIGGIAIDDYIICGCCGGIFELSEIYDSAPDGVNPIEMFENWVDLNAEIVGN